MSIIKYQYDEDNNTINAFYDNGTILTLKCSEVEEKLDTNILTRSRLQWLLDNDPLSYLEMALDCELQDYCTHYYESNMKQQNTIKEQLMNSGYNESTAQSIADEFMRYD